jgi:hypothetical protein
MTLQVNTFCLVIILHNLPCDPTRNTIHVNALRRFYSFLIYFKKIHTHTHRSLVCVLFFFKSLVHSVGLAIVLHYYFIGPINQIDYLGKTTLGRIDMSKI